MRCDGEPVRLFTAKRGQKALFAVHNVRRSVKDFAFGDVAGNIEQLDARYGFHDSVPLYSGGLGILAGDHCKTASDLRLPFVAILAFVLFEEVAGMSTWVGAAVIFVATMVMAASRRGRPADPPAT